MRLIAVFKGRGSVIEGIVEDIGSKKKIFDELYTDCIRRSMFCFFFSSRRRHTRCSRDWSSDVCSSDLFATASSVGRGINENENDSTTRRANRCKARRISGDGITKHREEKLSGSLA